MADPKHEVRSNDAASDASVARVDMKLEVVVIPVSDVDARRSSTGGSGGGSTVTSTTVTTGA